MRKGLKKAFTRTLWVVALVYLSVAALLHVPAFQSLMAGIAASALADKIGAQVSVGRIDLGFLNRIIIDDVVIEDQQGEKMLQAARLSAKVDVLPLMEGQVRVSSIQLFGLKAKLYQTSAEAKPNFQFLVDSLSSKDQKAEKPLDVQVQSLIIRNGQISWNQLFKAKTAHRINPAHLDVSNLSTHIALYTLTNDSLSARVKRLSLTEQSGIDLQALTFSAKASKKGAKVENLTLRLPHTKLNIKEASATYLIKDKKLVGNSLRYHLEAHDSYLSLSDLAFLDPNLATASERLSLQLAIRGTTRDIEHCSIQLNGPRNALIVKANGHMKGLTDHPRWALNINRIKASSTFLGKASSILKRHGITLPALLGNLGDIDLQGKCQGHQKNIAAEGSLSSTIGSIAFKGQLKGDRYNLSLTTPSFHLGKLLDNGDLGLLACNLTSSGRVHGRFDTSVAARGEISMFEYKDYTYKNLALDGTLVCDALTGTVSLDDDNGHFALRGRVVNLLAYLSDKVSPLDVDLSADIKSLNPHRLRLTDALGDRTFTLSGTARLQGTNLNNLNGALCISDFHAVGEGRSDAISNLQLALTNNALSRSASIHSDYGDAEIMGRYDYQTILQTLTRAIASRLPSLAAASAPFQPHKPQAHDEHFSFTLDVRDASLLERFLNIPLETRQPISIAGHVDGRSDLIDATVSAPSFVYKGTQVNDFRATIQTQGDSLLAQLQGERLDNEETPLDISARLSAQNDIVRLKSNWNASGKTPSRGTINASAQLFREQKSLGAHIQFDPSIAQFDTVSLAVQPSDLTYAKNRLTINRFEISNGNQHIIVNGQTTGHEDDSLMVDLQNINVAYVLDLVNFHSVDFSGTATGIASIKSLFHQPSAQATLTVRDFTFNEGEMGTLHAQVGYDGERVNIHAIADDGPDAQTLIDGYVSIKDNYIDLPIRAVGTRLGFLESFCSSFMDNINGHARGLVRVFGDLKNVNIEGDVRASGTMDITPLRTSYEMRNSLVHIVPDHIYFCNDTVYDQYGHIGVVTGELTHQSLRNLSYDINVEAQNLLAYDHKTYGENTFYGTVFATGNCAIRGKSGELLMDVNAIPEKGSFIEYNASDETTLEETEFIRWANREESSSPVKQPSENGASAQEISTEDEIELPAPDIPTDMHINFLVNTNQNFTLRILMDASSGDYIALNGDGVLRANYFNKGAFQMFGNYNVDHGVYKLTIQNVVKKEFQFQPGSTIAFGGDPYNAALNLKGVYTVNGASLSDLQLGNSFTRNNVRVNCIMDIKGTADQPTVGFDLDLPTLSSDAQAMVRSVINSEEDMNQQVLYLLAVGRFYPQGNNNASQDGTAQNQTSLAMQSLLSGTVSQQINTVISTLVKSSDWNFGANIATGDEGFSNAEYEGLLSGRMFNNRLLFNGQFGYRDNVTTNTSSFIGDFDLRYLLIPNGNVSVRVYNQTNDRYFTRNSLNTQGIGLILKKDFSGLKDFFWGGKKKRTK